jgi:hypothetical protein
LSFFYNTDTRFERNSIDCTDVTATKGQREAKIVGKKTDESASKKKSTPTPSSSSSGIKEILY